MLNLSKDKAIGIDLSESSVKVIQLAKKGKDVSLLSVNQKNIPFGLMQEGDIHDCSALAGEIKTAIKEVKGEKIKSNQVICNLPEEKVFIRAIELPRMKKSEMNNAVRWEAENHIPFSVDKVYLDWQVIKKADKQNSKNLILIAAAPRLLIDSYLNCLKEAGLEPIGLEPESVALVRSLIAPEEKNESTMIIDMGFNGFSFVVYSAGAIRFSARVNISGQLFDQAVAEKMNVSFKEAERLKIQVGLDKDKDPKVFKALQVVVDKVAEKAEEYISYYTGYKDRKADPNKTVSRILLCGGDAFLNNLPEYLSKKINLPVKMGNPWVNIYPFIPKKAQKLGFSYKTSLAYTVALGLALGKMKNDQD